MKNIPKFNMICCFILAGILSLHFLGPEAFAAEEAGDWRTVYDLVLRYINFGIIVFVFFKYGKTPLMNFLRGEKDKVARQIERIESQQKAATDKIRESRQALDEGRERYADIKQRIVEQGERKKEEMISDARQLSALMIADTKRKIDFNIIRARKRVRDELLDAAIEVAMERLPGMITAEDSQRFVDQYIAGARRASGRR
ncbi:MAG: ATP synthase F0 subunit B [Pseudomonadota bacterium]